MPDSPSRSLLLIPQRVGMTMSLFLLFLFFYLMLSFRAGAQSENQPLAVLIRKGQSALDAGDLPRAVQHFEEARQISLENPEVTRGLVLSYLQAGRLVDAQTVGEFAVARWPRDAQLQHWLGLVYFKQ